MVRTRPKLKKWRQAQKVSELYWWHQLSLTEACRQAGVSKATYYRWLNRWPDVAADYERVRKIRYDRTADDRFDYDVRRFLGYSLPGWLHRTREITPRKVFHPCAHVERWKGVMVTRHGHKPSKVHYAIKAVFEQDPELAARIGLTLGSIQIVHVRINPDGTETRFTP